MGRGGKGDEIGKCRKCFVIRRRAVVRSSGGTAPLAGCMDVKERSFPERGGARSYNVAWGVEFCVALSKRVDDPAASGLGRAEGDEKNLVLSVVDHILEGGLHADALRRREVAFEDGELDVVSEILAHFENPPESFVIGDVVGDDVGGAHGLSEELRS